MLILVSLMLYICHTIFAIDIVSLSCEFLWLQLDIGRDKSRFISRQLIKVAAGGKQSPLTDNHFIYFLISP